MTITDELQKLQQLYESGAISEAEYASAKAKILNPPSWNPLSSDSSSLTPEAAEQQTRQWAMLLHLSQLLGYTVIPFAGLVAPIIIWQVMKEKHPGLDEHGCNATNWIISSFIYMVVAVILVLALIGIPLVLALAVCAVVFPIVAAVKANNGEVWKYPMTIEFLKPQQSTWDK